MPERQRGHRRPVRPERARSELGGEQVEGRQAVRELLAAGRRAVRDVWVAEGQGGAIVDEIRALAADAGVPVRRVATARLAGEARSERPQGVLAHAAPLRPAEFDALLEMRQPTPFLVALDGVTDPHNLGSLVRSAVAAGATGLVLPSHGSARVTPAVTKAAAGAIEHLPLCVVSRLPAALSRANTRGVWSIGLSPEGEGSLFGDLNLADEPLIVVLGAEGAGLSPLVRKRCDQVVRIPQRGSVASLNVAVAGALAFFEVARRRSF